MLSGEREDDGDVAPVERETVRNDALRIDLDNGEIDIWVVQDGARSGWVTSVDAAIVGAIDDDAVARL